MDDDQGDRSVGDGDLSLFVLSSLLFLVAKSHCLIVLSCVFHQHVCFPPTASIYFCLIKNSRFLLATLSSSSSSPAAASFSFSAITQNHNERKTKSSPTLVAHLPHEGKTVNEQTTSDQSMLVNEMVSHSMSDDSATLSNHAEQDRVASFSRLQSFSYVQKCDRLFSSLSRVLLYIFSIVSLFPLLFFD